MNGRFEQGGDPVQWVDIVMVRCDNGQFFSMDCTKYYYLPDKEKHHSFYYETINYWMPYEEFNFPAPLLLPKES
ncbi:MAG TPA: hypothetical protein VNZ45_05120 [Bacteroidia bacterium]|nr:hypothetical protein [Bacteroidia bacterium]